MMAGCRALVYPLAGAASGFSVETMPRPIWAAATAMAAWVLVISVLAKTESRPVAGGRWILSLLVFPLVVGVVTLGVNALIPAGPLLGWIIWRAWMPVSRLEPATTVPDLLAGIPLVDLLSAAPQSSLDYAPFFAFTALALFLRRSIAAT